MGYFRGELLRQYAAYQRFWQGKVFVIYITAGLLEESLFDLAADVSFILGQGINLVVVVDGEELVDVFNQKHYGGSFADLTDGAHLVTLETLQDIDETLNQLTQRFNAACQLFGTAAVRLSPAAVKAFCHPEAYEGQGSFARLDKPKITQVLTAGHLAILDSVACQYHESEHLHLYISARQLAASVADELRVPKVLICTKRAGFFDQQGKCIQGMPCEQAQNIIDPKRWVDEGALVAGMDIAVAAVQAGVQRATLLSPTQIIQEIFTSEGAGTMVYNGSFVANCSRIRPAQPRDLGNLHAFLSTGMNRGILKSRTLAELSQLIDQMIIFEIDGQIVGTIGLQLYPGQWAEVISLWTAAYFRVGIGSQLLSAIEAKAKSLDCQDMFACVIPKNTVGRLFFTNHGYQAVDRQAVPAEKWQGYPLAKRQPLVLTKVL